MKGKRTTLLIRCSHEEAEKIREAAKREKRTLSEYVLHVVMSRIASQRNLFQFMDERRVRDRERRARGLR